MNISQTTIDDLIKAEDFELAEVMADYEASASKANIARLILEKRKREADDKLAKENIRIQYTLNRKLTCIACTVNVFLAVSVCVLAWALQHYRPF